MISGGASVYVHVPFCRAKCGYCTFISYPLRDAGLARAVVRRTVRQLEAWSGRLGGMDAKTVYVGGGTPSALPLDILEELLGGLRSLLGGRPAEFTVEANPESLSTGFMETCASHGVDRLSLGVQSFSARARSAVGRRCGDAEIAGALDTVARHWNGSLSLDLIAGLPGQRAGEVARDVDLALDHRPAHVSLYALTVEDRRSRIRPPPEADELWIEGASRLEEQGYQGYEVSNFAPPGRECLHNLRYWQLEPYLGVGPAAVSTLPDPAGGILRMEASDSLEEFLASPDPLGPAETERVSPRDFLFETLIMGLRLRRGLDATGFSRRFGRPFAAILPGTARGWTERGVLDGARDRIALTAEGRLCLNSLLVEAREEIDRLDEADLAVLWP